MTRKEFERRALHAANCVQGKAEWTQDDALSVELDELLAEAEESHPVWVNVLTHHYNVFTGREA